MPILGVGHAGIYKPLALVGLLLAVAEAARYGQGGPSQLRFDYGVTPPLVKNCTLAQHMALIVLTFPASAK
jgi:hypothetical protein